MGETPRYRITGRTVTVLVICGVIAVARAVSPGPGDDVLPPVSPDSPEARMAAARSAPCSAAVRVFQSLSADATVPDSVRKEASGCRADIAFALREYETARDYYKRAAAFERGPGQYRYRTAVAALANGDTADAMAMFTSVIDSGETPFRHEAAVRKGELLLEQEDYAGAMALFQKTGPFSFRNSWSIHALVGKLACARSLGLADSAAAFDRQLSGYRQTILEKERLRKVREIPFAKPEEGVGEDSAGTAAPAKDTAAADSTFALQVGAFGSKANADALMRRLRPKHTEVSCVPAVVEERTFYRVWVGNFGTREAAERFGRDRLLKEGYVYRVVVK
jgi:tetratricopeptide (TPR) repeat protein